MNENRRAAKRLECFPADVQEAGKIGAQGAFDMLTEWSAAGLPPRLVTIYMRLLWAANDDFSHPVNLTMIADQFNMDRVNLTHYVKKLVDAGLVYRVPGPIHRSHRMEFPPFDVIIRRIELAWPMHQDGKIKRKIRKARSEQTPE
ncbi:MAG: hypothetical protein NT031_19815 [Planctomycetota bacterium]|nr:hypothetical protein [Planctomycetota bacterium]